MARLPRYMADRKFQSGELVRVLPDDAPPSTDIAIMFADTRNLPPKTRAFINFLVREFRDVPEYQMTGS
ncbi:MULTISPECIES: LysR substrate-binding domain-containing protein [Roseobacteraceae]|uniref:LysR substrate-binding domain-containing protein n=1 Tax=Roseobacteraceae TaxID=2854170 RepID=UPI0037452E56